MMSVAREYGIPGVLKRIFYELLVNEAFWTTLAEDRKTISLEDSYLLKLYDARHYLQREWREFVCPLSASGRCDGFWVRVRWNASRLAEHPGK